MTGSLPKKQTPKREGNFEREKEKLKEAAAALDRDKNLIKRTKNAEISIKKESAILPNPQPQISTPVPSSANTENTNKKDQRISTMSDTQIMEKLSKYTEMFTWCVF